MAAADTKSKCPDEGMALAYSKADRRATGKEKKIVSERQQGSDH